MDERMREEYWEMIRDLREHQRHLRPCACSGQPVDVARLLASIAELDFGTAKPEPRRDELRP